MNKMKYETPNFDFQDMKLTENIADTCWGTNKFWVDFTLDGKTDCMIELQNPGCNGNSPKDVEDRRNILIKLFSKDFGFNISNVKDDMLATNVKNTSLISPVPKS